MPETPEILVVCTHNAGRSVAARVLLDHYGTGRVVARSASSDPGETVNPAVAQISPSDPAGRPVDEVRPIVDEIDRRARALLAEMLDPEVAP